MPNESRETVASKIIVFLNKERNPDQFDPRLSLAEIEEISKAAKNNHEKRMVALAIGAYYLQNSFSTEANENILKILHQLGGNSKKIRALEAAIKNNSNTENTEETKSRSVKKEELSKAMLDLLSKAQDNIQADDMLFLVKLVETHPKAFVSFNATVTPQEVLNFLDRAFAVEDSNSKRQEIIGSAALSIAKLLEQNYAITLPENLQTNLAKALSSFNFNQGSNPDNLPHVTNILRAILRIEENKTASQDEETANVTSALEFLLRAPLRNDEIYEGNEGLVDLYEVDLTLVTNIARGISYAFQINPLACGQLKVEMKEKVKNVLLEMDYISSIRNDPATIKAVTAAISNVARIGGYEKEEFTKDPKPVVRPSSGDGVSGIILPPEAFR